MIKIFFILVALVGVSLSQVTMEDFHLVISNSQDSKDTKKVGLEYPKSLETVYSVGQYNKLLFDFSAKLKKEGKKSSSVHQTFVRVVDHKSGDEFIAPSKTVSGKQAVQFTVADLITDLHNKSGLYDVELILGDSSLAEPTVWKLFKLNVDFSGLPFVREYNFATKPIIEHKFRQAEKRPHNTVSSAFTLAVLSPLLVLFVGWGYVGANLRNFPLGADFLYAVGFHACLGATLLLFIVYWISLTMMTTLVLLGVLSLPSAFFAHGLLNSLARRHKATKLE